MKQILIAILLLSTATLASAGGPWAIGKGNGYFQPGFTTKTYTGRYEGTYANTIRRDLNRRMTESNITFYAEYGLSQKLTLVADANYRFITSAENLENASENPYNKILDAGSLAAPGNPGVQLKYQLKEGALAFAIFARYQPNVSSGKPTLGLQTDFNASTYTGGISLGQGFEKAYWSGDIGFAARSNTYGESLQGNWQYGHLIAPKTYLILDINYVFTLENGTYSKGCYEQTALYLDNQGYVAYGVKIYSQFYKNLSFNLAFYSGFAVVNQGTQPGGLFGGLAYELKK